MTSAKLITNVRAATITGGGYGLIEDAAIAIEGGRIAWAGSRAEVPAAYANAEPVDLDGRLVTPALIDCHTHLVHGGNRAGEFEMRLEGATYEEIARAGGGIVSTVTATRDASEEALLASALVRADALIGEGVGVVEIKSGYGLDMETELKMLRVARRVADHRPLRVVTTFLGAHAVPKGVDADAYIDEVCLPALEAAHAEGLVDAVDGFCEGIAFSPAQIARVFDRAKALGLPVKLHAEQLSHQGGTELAAQYGALSTDHLEYITDADVRAMATAGSVAVLLPGAFYTLNEKQKPPVGALRDHGVPMAVATDWNPGTSPLGSLLLAMNMACTLFGLTPVEALRGTTCNAARALGLSDCGTITPGKRADLAVWNVAHPAELSYGIGINPLHKRIFGGRL
ncbi:imidazolonepropionase [Pseudovibrio sp. SPO723]|uniref:imidazolonepropionase n=1 Tax=Nesiotobacter zosterae TaxID=392721 RepID=UPI0029C2B255|nr:imidazolonepropionase [Pseudovibrio sp. SPO723]MDX5594288.1 imidazolonepropionase [Pseudovibrio sp. SPO723]